MQIHGLTQILGTQALDGASRIHKAEAMENLNALHGADQIEISSEAQSVGRVDSVDTMRMDRIEQIRQEIAAGVYETDEKLEIALGRLFDQIIG